MEITYKNKELNCDGDYSEKPWETYMDKLGGNIGIKGRDYFKAMEDYNPVLYRKRQYN